MNQDSLKKKSRALRLQGLVSQPEGVTAPDVSKIVGDIKKMIVSFRNFSSFISRERGAVTNLNVRSATLPSLAQEFSKLASLIEKIISEMKDLIKNQFSLDREGLKKILDVIENLEPMIGEFRIKVLRPAGRGLTGNVRNINQIFTGASAALRTQDAEARGLINSMIIDILGKTEIIKEDSEVLKSRRGLIGSGVVGGFTVPGFDNSLKGDIPRKLT
jgi:hypothetical protein